LGVGARSGPLTRESPSFYAPFWRDKNYLRRSDYAACVDDEFEIPRWFEYELNDAAARKQFRAGKRFEVMGDSAPYFVREVRDGVAYVERVPKEELGPDWLGRVRARLSPLAH
jgi:hypothetical protein